MTAAGWIYALGVWFAVVFGLAVLIGRKGDGAHRWMGRLYVSAMVILNIAGLVVLDRGSPSILHLLSFLSLVIVITGILTIRRSGGGSTKIVLHGYLMAWSFIVLLAAGVAQGAAVVGVPPPLAIAVVLGICGAWLHTRDLGRTARRLSSIDG